MLSHLLSAHRAVSTIRQPFLDKKKKEIELAAETKTQEMELAAETKNQEMHFELVRLMLF